MVCILLHALNEAEDIAISAAQLDVDIRLGNPSVMSKSSFPSFVVAKPYLGELY
jgi:hypothetical protein